MKIIFLDIDGVLNNRSFGEFLLSIRCNHINYHILDPLCVRAFNRVLNNTDAKIVISSAWRVLKTLQEIERIFSRQGVDISGRIIDKTGKSNKLRGTDIQKWLDQTDHNVTDFIIIDDGDDMGELIGHLEKTTWNTGFTEQNADNVIRYLNKE